jgi:hypothetical protein
MTLNWPSTWIDVTVSELSWVATDDTENRIRGFSWDESSELPGLIAQSATSYTLIDRHQGRA